MSYVIKDGSYYSIPKLWDKSRQTSIWQEFPKTPGEIRKFNKFWLKWEFVSGHYGSKTIGFYSRDKGKTWVEIDNLQDYKKPYYKELLLEVEKAQSEAIKAHNRAMAQERREKLKKGAKKAGLSLKDYKARLSVKRKENRKAKKQDEKAAKVAAQTNKKMKLAAALKDLLEVANLLQEQLLDGTELNLRYLNDRLHKIDQVTRYLETWAQRKKRK